MIDRGETGHLAEAAARLHAAEQSGQPCTLADLAIAGADEGMAVQRLNARRAMESGRRLAGYKLAMTNPDLWPRIGAKGPLYGHLWADAALPDGTSYRPRMSGAIWVEGEIALVLDRDVTSQCPGFSDLIRAIGHAVPAIEVLETRLAGNDLRLGSIAADNTWFGAYVLGGPARRIDGLDLRDMSLSLKVNDVEMSRGTGRQFLGGPLDAAVWLARALARDGIGLRAGEVILTGALGPMTAIGPQDRVDACIAGLGSASLRHEADTMP